MTGASAHGNGWADAAKFVVCIAILSIVYEYATDRGIHVVAFILLSMTFAGLALIVLTGRHAQTVEILKTPLTWWLGAAFIFLEGGYYAMLTTMPPAEASLVLRLALPVSLIVAAALFSRRLTAVTAIGGVVTVAGVVWLLSGFEEAAVWPGLIFGALAVGALTTRTFLAERHPHNRAATTIEAKLRVTGVLISAMCVALWGGTLGLMALQAAGWVDVGSALPAPSAFLDAETIPLAAGFGAAVFTALNYFQFRAVVALGSERFLAVTALLPIAVILAQAIASGLGIIDTPVFDASLLPVIAMTVVGSLLVAFAAQPAGSPGVSSRAP
ncbi:MAG: hypothetical protein AAFO62_01230 [Pseudomonadota bacterium]